MDVLQAYIARRLRVADADVVNIVHRDDGDYCVTLSTGAKVCVTETNYYACNDHPFNRGLSFKPKAQPIVVTHEVVEEAKEVAPVVKILPVEEIILPPSIASGNADAVLKWCGGDKDKCRAALTHERTKGKPRVVLIKQLEGVLDG